MTSASWRTVGMLAGMFVLGGVTGAGVMRAVVDRDMSVLLDAPSVEAQQRLRLRALVRRLGLSEPQKARIAEILKAQNEQCRPVSQRVQEELTQCREQALPEISQVLTPVQRDKLDHILRNRGRTGLPAPPARSGDRASDRP
jgi:hypothetical protein